ncbi:MAG: hypothetical protein ACYCSP_11690 [Acidobacteriaceae bacterium]
MRMSPGTSASFAKKYRNSQNFLVAASTNLKYERSVADQESAPPNSAGPVLRIVAVNPPKKAVA